MNSFLDKVRGVQRVDVGQEWVEHAKQFNEELEENEARRQRSAVEGKRYDQEHGFDEEYYRKLADLPGMAGLSGRADELGGIRVSTLSAEKMSLGKWAMAKLAQFFGGFGAEVIEAEVTSAEPLSPREAVETRSRGIPPGRIKVQLPPLVVTKMGLENNHELVDKMRKNGAGVNMRGEKKREF